MKHRRAYLAAVMLLLAALLAGCFGGRTTPTEPAAPAQTPEPTAVQNAEQVSAQSAEPAAVQAAEPAPDQAAAPAAGAKLDGSAFQAFLQSNTNYKYYALLPGIGNETVLFVCSDAIYRDAASDDVPVSGYYAYTGEIFRSINGEIVDMMNVHTMLNYLEIDTQNHVICSYSGRGGVHENTAAHYAEYDQSQYELLYDTLTWDTNANLYDLNGRSITADEYNAILAQREANGVPLQVFPIGR